MQLFDNKLKGKALSLKGFQRMTEGSIISALVGNVPEIGENARMDNYSIKMPRNRSSKYIGIGGDKPAAGLTAKFREFS